MALIVTLASREAPAPPGGTFTVTNNADSTSGSTTAGSLRDGIKAANDGNCLSPCTIVFGVTGNINLFSPLTVSSPNAAGLTIDGFSAGGSAQNSAAFGSALNNTIPIAITSTSGAAVGFDIGQPNVTIQGVAMGGFSSAAIQLASTGGLVKGCYLGTTDGTNAFTPANSNGINVTGSTNTIGGTTADAANLFGGQTNHGVHLSAGSGNTLTWNYIGHQKSASTPALQNSGYGILINGSAAGNSVGVNGFGNLISSGITGVVIQTGSHSVKGNRIGTNGAGTASLLGTFGTGIAVQSANNVIGGSTAGDGNLISGQSTGISLSSGSATTIHGNIIGLDLTGSSNVPNVTGISVGGTANSTIIGGINAGERNVISGNSSDGIGMSSNNNAVRGNYIGLNSGGSVARPNNSYGINVAGTGNVIGGSTAAERNIISSNGINVNVAGSGNTVKGNYIGTNPAGTAAMTGALNSGVNVSGANTIGGTAAGEGNLISGNGGGIAVTGTGAFIGGNYIGVNVAGTGALANQQHGIALSSATNVTIGGNSAAARNVISGNNTSSSHAIHITNGSGHIIKGNYIGTNAAGTAAVLNFGRGIYAQTATNLTIGGIAAGEGNVISGNNDRAIYLDGGSGSTVRGNIIGRNAANTAAIANNFGILIGNAGIGHTIDQNTIANNNSKGIVVTSTGTKGHNFTSNVIFGNGTQQVDLSDNGVDVNDATDSDAGPNNFQNYPTLESATVSGGNLTVTLSVNSSGAAGTTNLLVEIFKSSGAGVRDATVFHSSTCFATNVLASQAITTTAAPIVIGDSVTALVTNRAGTCGAPTSNDGTSEFSAAAVVAAPIVPGVVTNTNDSGTGSLRQAITDANSGACAAPCTITFNIPNTDANFAGGVYTIRPLTTLPDIRASNMTLDGATQTAFTGNTNVSGPEIVINGSLITGAAAGLQIAATVTGQGNNIIIRNVVVNGFPNEGIFLDGSSLPLSNISITQNYVGTDPTGTSAVPNGGLGGVYVGDSVSNAVIGQPGQGNVISGNAQNGVVLTGATSGSFVLGNVIGLNASGSAALPNGFVGIAIKGGTQNNTIGGTAAGARNVVSGNLRQGIAIEGITTANNVVRGNYIGTNAAGTAAIGNTWAGVGIWNAAQNNTVGGTTAGQGNVISGNGQDGVAIRDVNTMSNLVAGNYIGTDATGASAIANGWYGVDIFSSATSNTVGGSVTPARNVISGNTLGGVLLSDAGTTANFISGNYIGLNAAGSGPIANAGSGLTIAAGASGNLVGGGTLNANFIAHNGAAGIAITGASIENSIRYNSIFSNTGLGIDLANNGVTPNDSGDGDTGPNSLQNFPILTMASYNGGTNQTTISGTLNSLPSTQFDFDWYSNAAPDGSGYGEGQTYEGTSTFTTDALGNTAVSIVLPGNKRASNVVATASRVNGAVRETSEFSAPPPNNPPVANNDSPPATNEDTPTTFDPRTNDSDPEGGAFTITSNTQPSPAAGTVTCTTTSCTFTPVANYNGPASFNYTITDDMGATATATVNITVTAVNDPPVANADALGTNEDTPNTVNVLTNDTDIDGPSALTVTGSTSGTKGTVSCTTAGVCTYTPNLNQTGADSFTYTVSDGTASTVGTVNVTINAVNDPPVANADALGTNEDTPNTVNVLTNDTDVDGPSALTVTGNTSGTKGSATCTGAGVCTYTPNLDQTGTDSFTYTVSDGTASTVGTVNVNITAVNDPPVANADTLNTNEDTPNSVNVLTNDTDVDGPSTPSVTGSTNGTKGTVSCTVGGTCTYTPNLNQTGADSFTYTVSDGSASSVGTVNVNITAVNDPPVANADALGTSEDTPNSVNVLTNDTDVDGPSTLTVTGNTNGTKGTAACSVGGVCTYTPNANQNGPDSFTYTVSDGSTTSVGTVNVTINAVNDPPVANPDTLNTNEETPNSVNVLTNDTDVDGPSTLSVTGSTNGTKGTVSCTVGGTCTYTPNLNQTGADSFTYTVSDGSATAVGTVNVTINGVNDAPTANPDTLATNEDTPNTVNVLTNDSDGDGPSALTVTASTNGTKGTVSCTAGGNCTYTPTLNQTGADSFTYTVSDGSASSAGTVNVTINAVNDPPVASPDTLTTNQNTPGSVNVLANDSDVDGPSTLTVTGSTSGTKGTVSCNAAGNCVYTPNLNQTGADAFTYTVSDGATTATGSVSVNITSTNAPPNAAADSGETTQGNSVTLNVLFNDSDPDGQPLTVISNTQPANGSVVCQAGGNCTYTPNAGFTGVNTFTYTVQDTAGATSTATVTINVRPCPGAPNALTPLNNATGVPTSGRLFWDNAGAQTYSVYLGRSDANGCSTPFASTDFTFADYANLQGNTRYSWRIEAITSGCPIVSSACNTFTTAANCNNATVTLVKPLGGTLASPVAFEWQPVSGATEYALFAKVGTGNFTELAKTAATTFTASMTTDGTVQWFVTATIPGCGNVQSATATFTLCNRPATPLARVIGEATSAKTYSVEWDAVPNAIRYEVDEATNPNFTDAVTTSTDKTSVAFKHDATTTSLAFYYRVRAFSACTQTASDNSPAIRIVIIPVPRPEERNPNTNIPAGSTELVVQQVFIPGEPSQPAFFTAVTDRPWLTVRPPNGVLPPEGITLEVIADPGNLPNGTFTATVIVTITTPGAAGITGHGTSTTSKPISISLVTPVTPVQNKLTPSADSLIISSVGHLDGINSHWQSDIRVTNTSAASSKYALTFTPSAGTASGIKQTTITVGGGETTALDDIIKNWFGIGSLGDSANGMLEIRSADNTPLTAIASSRTYNVTANGTLGQYIPALPFGGFVGKALGNAAPTILSMQQISQSSAYRTNVGIVEASGQSAAVILSVFNAAGLKLTDIPLSLAGGEQRQLNSILAANNITLSDGRVEVKVTGGDGKVTAYASVVDNKTNDPLLVSGVATNQLGSPKYVLPGVADLTNTLASWRTDMRIFNTTLASHTANLTLHLLGGGTPLTASVSLQPGEVRTLDDVVKSIFKVADVGGAVHVSTTSQANLVVTGRTYNQTTEGTYGQFIEAVTPERAAGAGGRTLHVLQVEDSVRYRTNLGITEVSGAAATVEVQVILPDSKVTPTLTFTMAPNEFRQLGIVRDLNLGNVYNARLSVRVISGQGRVTAYGSVIDMTTQDPTYVPAQ